MHQISSRPRLLCFHPLVGAMCLTSALAVLHCGSDSTPSNAQQTLDGATSNGRLDDGETPDGAAGDSSADREQANDAATSDSSDSEGPLMIVTQPANLTVTDGQPAHFSVTASGNQPLTYQWKQGSTPVAGATTATLSIHTTIYKYHDGLTYSVVVTDADGSQLTSQAATLKITPRPPTITEPPLSQVVVATSTATFAVAATGSVPLTYQWNLNGVALSGAIAPSYTTGTNTVAQNTQSYTVTITNGANQTITSAPATLTVAAGALAPVIHVDCSEDDGAAAHQVTYRRGVVDSFDLDKAASAVVGNVKNDIQTSHINFLNAALDLNYSANSALFTYAAPNLTPSASGSAPLVQTFNLLSSSVPSSALPAVVQISGTPAAYSSNLDPDYAASCGCSSCNGGNFYPLPTPGPAMQVTQNAVESWIGDLNSSFPGAIWIGTQEPSHTLGYSTSYYDSDAGCSDVPAADSIKATDDDIERFISYWTPIALYLRTNGILSGGVQLNAGNNTFYLSTAKEIISAPMPLDYFTIQDYSPAPAVDQAMYTAYQEFQQNPDYLGVKVILDRYGVSLTAQTTNIYGTTAGVLDFLTDEAELMPYADMMYGYNVETGGIEGPPGSTLLPQVLTWLQAAPAPLRPLTSTTSDLGAFALVQKNSPQRAYIAIWNASSTAYTTSVVLDGVGTSFGASSLTVLKGSGDNVTTLDNSGITVNGGTISGLSLNSKEFLLVTLQ